VNIRVSTGEITIRMACPRKVPPESNVSRLVKRPRGSLRPKLRRSMTGGPARGMEVRVVRGRRSHRPDDLCQDFASMSASTSL
jgi:hypothetical protein